MQSLLEHILYKLFEGMEDSYDENTLNYTGFSCSPFVV